MVETIAGRRSLLPGLSLVLAVSVAALLLLAALARPVFAADITVNTTTDEDNADGDCSLREAVIAANTNAPRDACAAGSGTDTIGLSTGTYELSIPDDAPNDATVGDLDTTSVTRITGAGARATIIRGQTGFNDRIFENTGTTTISGLTVTGGNGLIGGGVRNNGGTLTLQKAAVTGNTTANRSGGVDVTGGTLNLTNSTISGNQSDGDGGAIYLPSGTANIVNSTVSGNRAIFGVGSGIVVSSTATASIESSTVASNSSNNLNPGGGIYATGSGTVDVKNTIVSDNTANNCDTGFSATITSQGNNVSSDGSCSFGQPTDQQDTDPLLGPLQDNDGLTDTHALLTASPAIDSGDSDQVEDQRGEARPTDGDGDGTATDDIGAFEKEAAPPPNTAPVITADIPSKTRDKTPTLTANVTDNESELASEDISIFVDGKAVRNSSYDPASGRLSFTSRKLKKGRHTLRIEATDGALDSSESFSFKVEEKKKR